LEIFTPSLHFDDVCRLVADTAIIKEKTIFSFLYQKWNLPINQNPNFSGDPLLASWNWPWLMVSWPLPFYIFGLIIDLAMAIGITFPSNFAPYFGHGPSNLALY
jgi:hypothetical protein